MNFFATRAAPLERRWRCVISLLTICLWASLGGARAEGAREQPQERPQRVFGPVGYTPPPGWSVMGGDETVQMLPPGASPSGSRCVLLLRRPVPAQGDPASQAEALVNHVFGALGRFTAEPAGDVKTNRYARYDGVSAEGWPFVDLYGHIGDRRSFLYAHVLLARVNGQAFAVLGLTPDNDRCLGGHDNTNWVLLFHSLRISGARGDTEFLKKELIGSWTAVNASNYSNRAFSANGHFGTVAGHSTYSVSQNTGQVFQETSTWLGDGTYQLHGDHLTMTRTNGSPPQLSRISIVRRPNPDSRGGFDMMLRMLQSSPEGLFVGTLVKDPMP